LEQTISSARGEQDPTTERRPVSDEYFGIKVTEDYRWLEDWNDPAVRAWSEAQNAHARAVLDRMPGHDAIRARVTALRSAGIVSYRLLARRGGLFLALKNQPPRQQPLLVAFADPDNPSEKHHEHIVVDPVAWDPGGLTAIDWYVPSPDGKLVAVSLSEGGSERGHLHLFEVASGKELADVVPFVNAGTAGGSVGWLGDSSGFYYTRYPRPGERAEAERDFFVEIYFHALGTPTAADRYELGREFPSVGEPRIAVAPDGATVLVNVQSGDSGVYSQFVRTRDGKWTRLTTFDDRVVAGYFAPDGSLFFLSRQDASRGKVLHLALSESRAPDMADATTVIPERADAVIQFDFSLPDTIVATPTRLFVVDQWGGPNRISVFSPSGQPLGEVELPPVTAVPEIVAMPDDGLLIRSTSFLEPDTWYALPGLAVRAAESAAPPKRLAISSKHPADFADTEVVREFATSKDGTRIPLSIVRRKDLALDGTNRTMLYGYGGFGISQRPLFWPSLRVWIERGGVFVVAHIRGGGEFGEEWHAAGVRLNKQNGLDDFIAAAEHLIARKYTRPERLALRGGSNGGLLVGAVMNQRPELFRAVVASVGIFDMLRSERQPNGVFNVPEYGTVKDPDQFRALYRYSPYHNVRDRVNYPSVLFLTGANDPRVNPMNSRKMTARLQAANGKPDEVLLRTSAASGHGLGTPLSELIEQDVDVYTFLFTKLR
jgi:prolyl oligopeptidase